MQPLDDTAVIIPAKNESARIIATVRAAMQLPGVGLVIVVDDGSTDDTGRRASTAGAVVVRHGRNRGKAAAMETGATAACARDNGHHRNLLFLDADLEHTAAKTADLITPVRERHADMTIALFPRTGHRVAGHGYVVRLSRWGVKACSGFEAEQPLSGQRCLTREAYEAALPLAAGFGVETGLTIDVSLRGFRIAEIPLPLTHRVTGTDWRSQLHRGRQFVDVAATLARRLPDRLRHGAIVNASAHSILGAGITHLIDRSS